MPTALNCTLADLKKGEKGKIIENVGHEIPLNLTELGCIPGKTIYVLGFAPLNDPIHVKINDTNFAIRKNTAKLISIQ